MQCVLWDYVMVVVSERLNLRMHVHVYVYVDSAVCVHFCSTSTIWVSIFILIVLSFDEWSGSTYSIIFVVFITNS